MHGHTFFYTTLGYTVVILALICSAFYNGRIYAPHQVAAAHPQHNVVEILGGLTTPRVEE